MYLRIDTLYRDATLMKIWDSNCFSFGSGHCVYTLACRFNHECIPNVARGFMGECIVFRAARDIQKGEELTVSYDPNPMTPSQRRDRWKHVYCMECGCHSYKSNQSVMSSDVRRMYIHYDAIDAVNITIVINRRTDEERRALSSVESWYDEIMEKLTVFQAGFEKLVTQKRLARTLRDSADRAELVEDLMQKMGECLRENNRFGLQEDVIKRYLARHAPIYGEVVEEMSSFSLEEKESLKAKL
ncbi:hypothetical protein DL98DRAFT_579877 [Cadophora sp. DSE1049]|nr:hypothetical protein DL98DRAFT_579877 [Cadophora sp. DSE1049]